MSSLPSHVIGWDIGGAHLKAVLLDAKGEMIDCLQLPCPLWKGLDFLQRAMVDVLVQLNLVSKLQPQGLSPQNIPAEAGYSNVKAFQIVPSSTCHAITMTGELVDLFETRHDGVCEIAELASRILGENCYFYAAPSFDKTSGFVRQQHVYNFTSQIASTNWHASASVLALYVQNALFVDIGSTTTDIIKIEGGKVISEGFSDACRMQVDSLVYTGVVRTPVMALAQKLPFDDKETNVAAEYFATMADVYRLTGELTVDDAETADGKAKTQQMSARRLARMIGHDVDIDDFNKNSEKWIKLALSCRNLQIQQIQVAMLKQLKPNMTIIGAGAGSFLVKQIAADLGYQFMSAYKAVSMRSADKPTNDLNLKSVNERPIDLCFPAYAVALLALKQSIC